MDNFVIEVLNEDHRRRVKKYFEDKYPVEVSQKYSFSNTKEKNCNHRFYGIVNENMDFLNESKISHFKIKIMTLEELEKKEQEFPKLMYVWDSTQKCKHKRVVIAKINDPKCKYPILAIADIDTLEDYNNLNAYNNLIGWMNCREIEEENPLKKEFDKLQQQIKELQTKANEIQQKL